MNTLDLILLAIGVAMDAFAVSIAKGLSANRIQPSHCIKTGLWFGGFQALMPLIGYFIGTRFSSYVENYDHWLAFCLLGCIGGKMALDSFKKTEEKADADFSAKTMLIMAIATSIDALAVGTSLAFVEVNIGQAILWIGLITFGLSAEGVKIGNACSGIQKSKAELIGGIILILIGAKILVQHLCQ